jgi:hypothetical protein
MSDTTVKVKVSVESYFTGQLWEGEVDVPSHYSVPECLEFLFRFFNRASDEDNDRLEKIGFKQPSMSVGDMITLEGVQNYKVINTGFKLVP